MEEDVAVAETEGLFGVAEMDRAGSCCVCANPGLVGEVLKESMWAVAPQPLGGQAREAERLGPVPVLEGQVGGAQGPVQPGPGF